MSSGSVKNEFGLFSLLVLVSCVTVLLSTIWLSKVSVNYIQFKQQKSAWESRETLIKAMEKYNSDNVKFEKRRLPQAIGIGIKKCGTDGLLTFLQHHPMVRVPAIEMETFFFTHRYQEGIKAYKKQLPLTNAKQMTIEKTPIYYFAPPYNVPERIKKTVPDVKLFMIVCDPTARALSDFAFERFRYHRYNNPLIKHYETFEAYVDHYLPQLQEITKGWNGSRITPEVSTRIVQLFNENRALTLLSNGLYAAHYERWNKVFNASRLLIIDGNRFVKNPGPEIERLQEYLGLPKVLYSEDFVPRPDTGFYCYRRYNAMLLEQGERRVNDTEYIKTLQCLGSNKGKTRNGRKNASSVTMQRLREFYEPYNRAFYHQLGVEFDW